MVRHAPVVCHLVMSVLVISGSHASSTLIALLEERLEHFIILDIKASEVLRMSIKTIVANSSSPPPLLFFFFTI